MQDQEMLDISSTALDSHLESGGEALESPSQSTSDPTLSLRAAALSTLKSKRRRPASSQSLASQRRSIVTDNSVQLDYGQDDSEPPKSDAYSTQLPLDASAEGLEDMIAREEGEISDSEEAAAQPKSVEQPPESSSSSVQHNTETTTSPGTRSPITKPSSLPDESVPLKTESPPPHSNLVDRISDPEKPPSAMEPTDAMDVDTSGPFVDEDHVRPGLNMTQDQYDTAKDIVLDLLGWGVPPGYLVDCGLSREIVFYVFSELNLRLPDGFDAHDLVPYNPSTVGMLVRAPAFACGQPSFTPTPGSPSKIDGSAEASTLHDMEKQRREELLARKAASRKDRGPMPDSPSGYHPDFRNGDSEASVPTETVDDFLKTIESGDEPLRSHSIPQNHDPMEVDGSERGKQDVDVEQDPTTEPPTSASIPPTSADSELHAFDQTSRRSSSSGDVSVSSGNGQKRGTKRPVAADFVDFDHSPHPANGHTHPALKRKTGSFASLSTNRRCVIDLSDDDEGGDGARSRAEDYEPPVVAPSVPVGEHSTPPVGPPSATSTPRMLSPGALAEKERQIEEMRQMIAQREKYKSLRFKKTTAPTSAGGTETPLSVKQEEQEEQDMPSASDATKASSNGTFETMDIDTSADKAIKAPMNGRDGDDHSSVASTPPPKGPLSIFCLHERKETSNATQNPAQSSVGGKLVLWTTPSHLQTSAAPPQDKPQSVDVEPKSSSAQVNPKTRQHHQRLEEKQDLSQGEPQVDWPAYKSIFDGYPLLRSRPPDISEYSSITQADRSPSSSTFSILPSTFSFSSSSTSSTPLDSSAPLPVQRSHVTVALPDLNPLKLGALLQATDPSKPICQYEIPGGGTCRDTGCEDNHPSRIGLTGIVSSQQQLPPTIEPTDQDTAEYLTNFVPESWQSQYGSTLVSKIVAALEEARVKHPSMSFDERVASATAALELQQRSSSPLPIP
ncbi:hypothetical protein PQX77_004053 [Marasmius sp. AFHP31]|nr:hypothetical protein PQX77_004053 [Marasmius sp. AFHP31]